MMRTYILGLLSGILMSVAAIGVAEESGLAPTYPLNTKNGTIVSIYAEYQVMLEEINMSVSRGNAGLLSHDATRWKAALASLSAYLDFAQSRSIPDKPVTHGRNRPLTSPLSPVCEFKSNPFVCELMGEIGDARDELVVSASSEITRSLYSADEMRQREYWQSMLDLIAYMETYNPMDQPVTAAEENLGITPPHTPGTPPAQ